MLLSSVVMTEWSVSIRKFVNLINVKQRYSLRCLPIWTSRLVHPDLCILFTNTVSHKMVRCAVDEAEKKKFKIVRCHTSSGSALEGILLEHAV